MGLFDFFRRKHSSKEPNDERPVDRSNWTGANFEFLITGVDEIPTEGYQEIMSPNSFSWSVISKNDWEYYKVGDDEYSFSVEIPGIQLTFNNEVKFPKAKKIADEIVTNLKEVGKNPKLLILDADKIYKF